jgi:hypothetical protein
VATGGVAREPRPAAEVTPQTVIRYDTRVVIIGARNEEQPRQDLDAVGWNLTIEQVGRLDAAGATTPAYPYRHQRGFAERDPPPVG